MTIPDFIKCNNCGKKTYPDRKPDPIWSSGIYTYKCDCGWKTHVNIGIDTAQVSSLTTTTKIRDKN